jgi:hypothetical protein
VLSMMQSSASLPSFRDPTLYSQFTMIGPRSSVVNG